VSNVKACTGYFGIGVDNDTDLTGLLFLEYREYNNLVVSSATLMVLSREDDGPQITKQVSGVNTSSIYNQTYIPLALDESRIIKVRYKEGNVEGHYFDIRDSETINYNLYLQDIECEDILNLR